MTNEPRDHTVTVQLTAAQYEALERFAAQDRKSVVDYVRDLITPLPVYTLTGGTWSPVNTAAAIPWGTTMRYGCVGTLLQSTGPVA